MKKQEPSIGDVLAVGFLVLIFWMIWLALVQKAQEAAAPQVQEKYYVVVPY